MLKKSSSILKCYFRRVSSVSKLDGFDRSQYEKISMEPFEYIQKAPSKHYALLAPAFNHWLQVPTEKFEVIEKIARNFITAITINNDITDGGMFRYGIPATHRVFSVGRSINTAALVLLSEINKTTELGHPLASRVFLNRLIELHHGFGTCLYWRDHCLCPTEAAYFDMIKQYVGPAILIPLELLQLFSDNKTDFTELVMNISLFYRVVDDYYNLFYPETLDALMNVKDGFVDHSQNSDIKDGQFSVAIIHAMQFPDIASELTYILKQRTSDPELQSRFVKLLKKHGSDKYMREMVRKLDADIRTEIDRLGGNPVLTYFMDDLGPKRHEAGQKVQD